MSINFRSKIQYALFQAFMKNKVEKQPKVLELWKEQGSEESMNFMRGIVPVKTSFLRDSIDRRLTEKGFSVFARASYSIFVDQGTKPHDIFPKNAHILHWFGPNGENVFSTHSRHPGSKGKFFIRQTRKAMKTVLKQLYLMIWREQN